ncbi:MAG: hypothetical protein WKG07_41110 [Hymenobacter sp.]
MVVPPVLVNIPAARAYVFADQQPKAVPVTLRAGRGRRERVAGLAGCPPAGRPSRPRCPSPSKTRTRSRPSPSRCARWPARPRGKAELRAVATVGGHGVQPRHPPDCLPPHSDPDAVSRSHGPAGAPARGARPHPNHRLPHGGRRRGARGPAPARLHRDPARPRHRPQRRAPGPLRCRGAGRARLQHRGAAQNPPARAAEIRRKRRHPAGAVRGGPRHRHSPNRPLPPHPQPRPRDGEKARP